MARLILQCGIVTTPLPAFGPVMITDALDGEFNDFRGHFQSAVDCTSQRLGLHHSQTQIVAILLRLSPVVPATIAALRILDQF